MSVDYDERLPLLYPGLLCAASHSWEVSAIQERVNVRHHLCLLPLKHQLGHWRHVVHQRLWLVRVPVWEAMASGLVLVLRLQDLGHAGQRCLDCLWRGQRMVMLTVQDVHPSLKREQWHLAGLATSDDAALAVVMTVSVTSAAGAAAPVQAQHPAHWSLAYPSGRVQHAQSHLPDSLPQCARQADEAHCRS